MTMRRGVGGVTCQSGVLYGIAVDICVLRPVVNDNDEDARRSGCRVPSNERSFARLATLFGVNLPDGDRDKCDRDRDATAATVIRRWQRTASALPCRSNCREQ